MRAEYFYSFTLGSALGIASESFFGFGYSFSILCAFLAIVLSLLCARSISKKHGFMAALVFLGCAIGALRVDVSQIHTSAHNLDRFIGGMVHADGIVVTEPDMREDTTNIIVEIKSIDDKNIVSTNVLVHAPPYPEIKYGDEVSIVGKIIIPQNFAPALGQRAFDYRAYLANNGIYYEMPFSKISIIGHSKSNWVFEKLFEFKYALMKNIARVIAEPESSLGAGIVLGAKQSLGKEWMQKFRDAGLAHILVLSGYNIAVVASVIARAVSFLPFGVRLGTSAVGIVLFAIMVGGGATVLRATLMALVVILARATGRESDALRVLVLVGWIMVMVSPTILLSDVSFQLSFMAALALIVFVPLVEKYFAIIKNNVLREIVVTTIATQIFVAPILLFQMGNFSLVGFISNIFVLPIVPLAMFLVSLVSVFAAVPLLGPLVAFPTQLLLSYILMVVNVGARASFANVHVASFGAVSLVASYIIIFIACHILDREKHEI